MNLKPFFLLLLSLSFLFIGITHPRPAHAAVYGVAESVTAWIGKATIGCPSNPSAEIAPFCRTECAEDPELATHITGCGNQDQNLTSSLFRGMGTIYANRPAGTDIYLADLIHNINPAVQPAYAQGLGFASLSPILQIWKAFRNIAYFFFVIIFIVVGFAIMLRTKLNPQTVVSIESTLPNLLLTLLLITFSYTIAGLLIDLMYLSIFIIIGLAKQYIFEPDALSNLGGIEGIALNGNIISNTFNFISRGGLWSFANSIANIIRDILDPDLGSGDFLTSAFSTIIGLLLGVLAWAIFGIVIVFNAFKIFFILLTTYIQIILFIIFSPIILLANALPGSNAFTNWLKNLTAHLALYPAIIVMILLAFALTGIGTQNNIGFDYYSGGEGQQGFSPPQIGGSSSGAVQGLLSIGILMAMPTVLEKIKAAFGVGGGPGGGGGSFIGGALGGAIGAGLSPFKMGWNLYKPAALGAIVDGALTGNLRGGIADALLPHRLIKRKGDLIRSQQTQADYYKKRYEQLRIDRPELFESDEAIPSQGSTDNNGNSAEGGGGSTRARR